MHVWHVWVIKFTECTLSNVPVQSIFFRLRSRTEGVRHMPMDHAADAFAHIAGRLVPSLKEPFA